MKSRWVLVYKWKLYKKGFFCLNQRLQTVPSLMPRLVQANFFSFFLFFFCFSPEAFFATLALRPNHRFFDEATRWSTEQRCIRTWLLLQVKRESTGCRSNSPTLTTTTTTAAAYLTTPLLLYPLRLWNLLRRRQPRLDDPGNTPQRRSQVHLPAQRPAAPGGASQPVRRQPSENRRLWDRAFNGR